MRPHRGVLILVLGILGLLMCGIFTGIPAWVMGSSDLKDMAAGTMDPSGRGTTQAGKILGMIATILGALGLVIFIIVFITGGLAAVLHRQ